MRCIPEWIYEELLTDQELRDEWEEFILACLGIADDRVDLSHIDAYVGRSMYQLALPVKDLL